MVKISLRILLFYLPEEPLVPKIEGAKYGITSDGFFELNELPSRVAVVGGGYIGVELAGVLNSLGSEVSLFVRSQKLLNGFDELIQSSLEKDYREHGIKIEFETSIDRISKDKTLHTNKGDFSGMNKSSGPLEEIH